MLIFLVLYIAVGGVFNTAVAVTQAKKEGFLTLDSIFIYVFAVPFWPFILIFLFAVVAPKIKLWERKP